MKYLMRFLLGWIVLTVVLCCSGSGGEGPGGGNPDSTSQALETHILFGASESAGLTVLDRQLVRDSNGALHAFVLLGGGAEGCMGVTQLKCVFGGGTFRILHYSSGSEGKSWSKSGSDTTIAADVSAHMLASAGRNGETMAGVGYKYVSGTDLMGGLTFAAGHSLFVWPGVNQAATTYPTPMASDGELGATPGPIDFIVADRFNRYLFAQQDVLELTDPAKPLDTTWGIARCTQELLGYLENGRGGAEFSSQHAGTATPDGDLVVLNWNTIRMLNMSLDGTCTAYGGSDYHNPYAPNLYLTRQIEGQWSSTTQVTSDFLRDFHLNIQGDPPADWYNLALLDLAVDSDGTLFVLGNIRHGWNVPSGEKPIPFTGLFRVDESGGASLVLVQMLSASSARFHRLPDGGLAVGTDERHVYFLANGGVGSVGYGPAGIDGRASLMLSKEKAAVFQESGGAAGGQFSVYAVGDLGPAPEGSITITPAVGPTPLPVVAKPEFTAEGSALEEAFWFTDFKADPTIASDLAASPDGAQVTIASGGSHIVGVRVATKGDAEPAADINLTPPSVHSAGLAMVEAVEPVGGTWMERFPVQAFNPISAFGVLMNDVGIYEVEAPATLHIYGRSENGKIGSSSTYTAGTPPWGPPPPASSTELHGIALEGDRLIVNLWSGGGIGFVVLDVSNAPDYVDLGTITAFPPQPNFYPICRDFDVKNGLLAAGGDYRFHLVDVANMAPLGTYDVTGDVLDIMKVAILDNGFVAVMADTRLAIIDPGLGGEGHGELFDIVGWLNTVPGNTMIGAVGNRVAFTTNGDLIWVDCTDPTNPQVGEPLVISGLAWTGGGCQATSDSLWCANYVGSVPTGVSSLDVYDPISGNLMGRYLEPRTGFGSFGLSANGDAIIPLGQNETRIVRWHR